MNIKWGINLARSPSPSDHQEHAAPILSLCHDIFTNRSIFRPLFSRNRSLEGPRRSIHGCQIKTHQLSIVEYGSPNTTETILINSQIYHKSQAEIKESRACSTVSNAFFLDLGNNRVDVSGIYI